MPKHCDQKTEELLEVEPPKGPVRILLIDDDEEERLLTSELLDEIPGKPYILDWTPRYEEGLQAICDGTHDLYLLDYQLGEKSGIDLLRESKGKGCSGPVILFTGRGHSRTDLEALDSGADDYLDKFSLKSEALDRAMRFALAKHREAARLEQSVRERTEELACVNEALREADRRKDIFIATLAHELRNPLAPLRNTLEILRLSGDADDAARSHRERMERQVALLQRLLDDLLDVTRMTSGKLKVNLEPITLQEAIDAALEASRPTLDRYKVDAVVELPEQPLMVMADRVRLAQIFTNLINNAAKFSDPYAKIYVKAQTKPAHQSFLEVQVIDHGIGMTPEVIPQLFKLFTQIDRSLTRNQGGLGIGLSLVSQLVEMHGGTVAASSDGPNKGSTFTVSLPSLDAMRSDELRQNS